MSIFQKIKSFITPKKIVSLAAISSCLFLFYSMNSLAQQNTVVYKKDILHYHTGNSTQGGGCYSIQKTGTNTHKDYCDGTMNYWPAYDTTTCSACGASYSGDQSHRGCWHYETETTYYTYYELGCGAGDGACVGSLSVVQSTADWTKNLVLTASYQNTGSMKVSDKPYIWNGTQAGSSNTYSVNANGSYTLQLNADEASDTRSAIITIPVKNVDVTAPAIQTHTLQPASGWTKDGVLITITSATDLQPDGSAGCGLHGTPYSFDGGKTWSAQNSFCYTKNGTHTIFVRDRLDNRSTYSVSIQNIDSTPPVIEAVEFDHTKNISSTKVEVNVKDVQPDGSAGSGLHKTAYSFDGGKTWTGDNTYTVTQNGILKIAVRDQSGNIVYREVNIQNLDCIAPEISYTMSTDMWTNEAVTVYLSVSDINEDGTQGSGLAEEGYSLDGGDTWFCENELVFEENGHFTITARDRNNNISTVVVDIMNIDKKQPEVSVTMEVLDEGLGKKVKLQAEAEDEDSGIPDEAYSWDEGSTYSDQSSKIVTENGTYQVYVRDKAGNESSAVIEVDVFRKWIPEFPFIPKEEETTEEETEVELETEEETETELESEMEVETETELETEETETETEIEESMSKTETETTSRKELKEEPQKENQIEPKLEKKTERMEKSILQPKTKNKTKRAEEEMEPETETQEWETEEVTVIMEERIDEPRPMPVKEAEKNRSWETLLWFLGLLLVVVFTFVFMVLIWSRTIAVYVKKPNGRKQYMGRLWILRKDEHYIVKIPDSIMKKAMTMCFRFRPSLLFVYSHKNEEVHFWFPDGVCITLTIERNMEME